MESILGTSNTDEGWDEPVGLLRSVTVGALVGVVLSFIGTTIGMLVADVEWGAALGLGAFVAFWGGLGFGSMVGGVVWVSNNEWHLSGHEQSPQAH